MFTYWTIIVRNMKITTVELWMMENIMDNLSEFSHSMFVATGANTIAA
jgi:hypothetical protein